jgi:hypothetical protein
MTDPLLGVRIKIDRAKKHLADLDDAIRAFQSRKPYLVYVEFDSKPGYETYRFRERERIPVECSAVLGDCIHNMRSALDHLATALVLANGATPTQYTAFPIGSSETNFRTSGIGRMKGASDAAIKLVESFKPYKGGNVSLYRLHILDIADKHQLLLPVVVFNKTFGIKTEVRKKALLLGRDWMFHHAGRKFALKDRDILFSFKRISDGNLQDDSEFQFGFEIAFSEPQVLPCEPVVPTLNQLLSMTNGIIESFATILGAPW